MKSWMTSIKALAVCFSIMLATSCGQGTGGVPQINGVKGPLFNVVGGQVLMTFEFLNLQVDAGFKAPINKTKNSFVELAPNAINGGMIFQVYLDPTDLENLDIGTGDGNYLPDGRAVPGIPGGKLENSLRIDTNYRGISFYYHETLFGLWIPFGWDTAGISGYWNMNMNGKNIGFLGLVGNDPVRDLSAGGIVLLNRKALKDSKLKALIKRSQNNPHHIY